MNDPPSEFVEADGGGDVIILSLPVSFSLSLSHTHTLTHFIS